MLNGSSLVGGLRVSWSCSQEPRRAGEPDLHRDRPTGADRGGAIDTIAEVGYAGASFARIAERLGISRGLISYHFAGKDDLIKQVVHEVVQQGMAYMRPRILAHQPARPCSGAYIESNLA